MTKEGEFEKICDRISLIFTELSDIVGKIKDNFVEENSQDPQLNMEIIDKSFKSVTFNAQVFLGYKKRSQLNWTLEKYINFSKDELLSFFREFDNPFLGSHKWTPRIKVLLTKLSNEYDEFDKLLHTNSES